MTKVLFDLPTGLVRGIGDFVSSSDRYRTRKLFYQAAIIRFAAEHNVEWKDEAAQVREV